MLTYCTRMFIFVHRSNLTYNSSLHSFSSGSWSLTFNHFPKHTRSGKDVLFYNNSLSFGFESTDNLATFHQMFPIISYERQYNIQTRSYHIKVAKMFFHETVCITVLFLQSFSRMFLVDDNAVFKLLQSNIWLEDASDEIKWMLSN